MPNANGKLGAKYAYAAVVEFKHGITPALYLYADYETMLEEVEYYTSDGTFVRTTVYELTGSSVPPEMKHLVSLVKK